MNALTTYTNFTQYLSPVHFALVMGFNCGER